MDDKVINLKTGSTFYMWGYNRFSKTLRCLKATVVHSTPESVVYHFGDNEGWDVLYRQIAKFDYVYADGIGLRVFTTDSTEDAKLKVLQLMAEFDAKRLADQEAVCTDTRERLAHYQALEMEKIEVETL